ncbi:sugar phosphate isomerase/epimerase family protein [Maridesulfovibrio salexigens]|uniref:Xylose isomerase domain protein TIM barrel n=1 Tax=Maridesulfovibrio salexigens (strain ATCC 14822 / DSM 2638 / NCIMB 8403 / VKM B-1763) TaxID=526222 RepID=C6C274_MARSD|nr:sugar phosphate isomerase/epimerase family protein [Maridesulfovibrio salexigens]ACS81275.1 Xylose isomerase domain protein TIM barrel [Maridesulfovibrio salexigens DSM 2638]
MKPEFETCYVNLPLRYIYNSPEYLDFFIENSIQPELGLDCLGDECLSMDWLMSVRDRLEEAELKCTVHLPFLDLKPSSLNPAIRNASIDTLLTAFELAKFFSPQRMVLHPSFTSWLEPPLFERSYTNCVEGIRRLSNSWPDHPPLCLENTYEFTPDAITRLVTDLDRDNIGICFDLGHWFSFSKGAENDDFDVWFNAFAPYIKHVHLHDNHGSKDEHLALGRGSMNWDYIISRIGEIDPLPTFTLEPHNREDFDVTYSYFREHVAVKLF